MDLPPRLERRSSRTDSTSTRTIDTDTENLKIDCWVYGDLPSIDFTFNCDKIENDAIGSWLRQSGPWSFPGRKEPSAGLRLSAFVALGTGYICVTGWVTLVFIAPTDFILLTIFGHSYD
jgi:hypothetical protein